jgi:E3 ubiquitin-protein ligase RNF144
MEATATADDTDFPVYISDEEEDSLSILGASYNAEEIQIQEAILLSIDSSRAPTAAPSSSSSASSPVPPAGPDVAGPSGESTEESPRDRKGKRQLSSEGTQIHSLLDASTPLAIASRLTIVPL